MNQYMGFFVAAGVLVASITMASFTMACGIEGTAVYRDGSKVNGSATISTSWNSKKAFPQRGRYRR